MISCIAIDDEPIALDVIKAHAVNVPFLTLKASFLSPFKAIDFLQSQPIDLVFLDIKMPDISGVELAKFIDKKTKIIFTTAYTDFAIQAFELAAIDYLLKPIGFNRFQQACLRAQEQIQNNTSGEKYKSLFIKDGYEWTKVNPADLLYLEANDNYVIFNERERKITARMTLSEAQKNLPDEIFIRVHKSFIINFSKIEKIENDQITINGIIIPVSLTYREDVMRKIKK